MNKFFLFIYYFLVSNLPHSRFLKSFNWFRVKFVKLVLGSYGGGEHAYFENKVYIGKGINIKIGLNCHINENVFLQSCEIGDNVLIAPDTVMLSSSHRHEDFNLPIIFQGNLPDKPVKIGSNVWIGRRVLILPGVEIGSNTIVGAGSVVTKSLPSGVIAVGNPCKVIKFRNGEN